MLWSRCFVFVRGVNIDFQHLLLEPESSNIEHWLGVCNSFEVGDFPELFEAWSYDSQITQQNDYIVASSK